MQTVYNRKAALIHEAARGRRIEFNINAASSRRHEGEVERRAGYRTISTDGERR